ncbi:phosphorelay protein [Insolitispirillum peregrinum]|uniref:Hpt domain-containing protein n=1 Tax=Insolitispirillum peregrinum TaxID=80876 RepID=A0A1N7MJ53_9PROT|nr:phosphorelay protein [Insolitispirillum peregrinum]SIS86117.1 hypothetical protein SAMN05421779_104158 [Insolitispirillum peregrinum]
MSGTSKPEFIQPPSTLKDKVAITNDGVDLDALEQAELLIAGMQGSYLEWVEEDLKKIYALYAQAQQETGSRKPVFKDIFSVAHDVKGQGGSFNYPLMTIIGNLLCRFLERLEAEDTEPKDSHMAVVKVHIDAMRLVISQRMEGEGGRAGDNLVRGLNAALSKIQPPKDPAKS